MTVTTGTRIPVGMIPNCKLAVPRHEPTGTRILVLGSMEKHSKG